jgi:hypothetical protein
MASSLYYPQDNIQGLCAAVANGDAAQAEAWRQSPAWQTVEMLMASVGLWRKRRQSGAI